MIVIDTSAIVAPLCNEADADLYEAAIAGAEESCIFDSFGTRTHISAREPLRRSVQTQLHMLD